MKKKQKFGLKAKLRQGARGAISLFLIVLLTPFVTIAALLLEIQHYHSSVALLDEAMGVSAVSVLSNYDSYIKDRWGLAVTDQNNGDLNDIFASYLEPNTSVLGNSIQLNSTEINGQYPLTDPEVLGNRIVEYSKYNIPTEVAKELLPIDKYIKELEGKFNLASWLKTLKSGTESLDAGLDLVESQEKIEKSIKNIQDAESTYNSKYEEYKNAVSELATLLANPPADDADEETVKKYNADVEEKENNLASKKSEYQSAIGELTSAFSDYETNMETLNNSVKKLNDKVIDTVKNTGDLAIKLSESNKNLETTKKSIKTNEDKIKENEKTIESNKTAKGKKEAEISTLESQMNAMSDHTTQAYRDLETEINQKHSEIQTLTNSNATLRAENTNLENDNEDLKKDKEKYEVEVKEYETQKSFADAGMEGDKKLVEQLTKTTNKYDKGLVDNKINELNNVKDTMLNSLEVDKDTSIDDSYHPSTNVYITSDELGEVIAEMEEECLKEDGKSFIKAMMTALKSLVKCTALYEPSFDALINTGAYDEVGGLPGEGSNNYAMNAIEDIGSAIEAADGLYHLEGTGLKRLKNLFKNAKKLVESINSAIDNIILFQGKVLADIPQNIGNFFSTNRVWYVLYCNYLLPCRTESATLGKAKLPPNEAVLTDIPGIGDIAAIVHTFNAMKDGGAGGDLAFYQAELEYIMLGTKSELANQIYVFGVTYLIRLLLDIPAVFSNSEVEAIASALGVVPVVGPVLECLVYILEVFLEPFVDTLILVNNGKIPMLFESTLYLTPSGIPNLVTAILSFKKMTDEQKKAQAKEITKEFSDMSKSMGGDEISESIVDSGGSGNILTELNINYHHHTMLLLALTVNNQDILARLMNLMEMESYYNAQQASTPMSFDLHKSYTNLELSADVKINQIAPSLTDQSIFETKRTLYRGY